MKLVVNGWRFHTFTSFTHNGKVKKLRNEEGFCCFPTSKPAGYYDYLYIKKWYATNSTKEGAK